VTYTILGRDTEAGQIGMATQSHFFGAARLVAWARSGVGVVATQSFADASYGPLGLEMMASGRAAPRVLQSLTQSDEHAAIRQAAVLDVQGHGAIFTGDQCIPHAGGAIEADAVAIGNMLRTPKSWLAMLDAFARSSGELASRLLTALEACEATGGDLRGRQSAGIVVVATSVPTSPCPHLPLVDLRVEDSADPLAELRRLLQIRSAAEALGVVLFDHDLLHGPVEDVPSSRIDAVAASLDEAQSLVPDNLEPAFWKAVVLARAGRTEQACAALRRTMEANPDWLEFLDRVAASSRIPPEVHQLLRKELI
jgi:uncharacterized Ntn-hydrolase superfamily protein